ncbi:hypothetical protein JCM31826_17550 [Thermaurantimonas aggregans]|uniref:DUF6745 domain-containing protein n=1 Tax=Thermaurantimonas aggregans TaxID=2173829 RepID=A0A401XMP3_9FLAO|nr:hypothetical protein [Thermaurantimonas aggregans]MCX8147728.1 hypothetical protein [Thermaurantimonas aggregans]GCD78273.1 hypothetical protein JCM31826_17550 [Thermaurantimonas aggregans]
MESYISDIISYYYNLGDFQPPAEIAFAQTPAEFSKHLAVLAAKDGCDSLHSKILDGFRQKILAPLSTWLQRHNLTSAYHSVFNAHYRTRFLNLKHQRDSLITALLPSAVVAEKIRKIPQHDFLAATYIEAVFIDFLKNFSQLHPFEGQTGLFLELYRRPIGFLSFFTPDTALVLRWPDAFETMVDGTLHSAVGPALQWVEEKHYFYSGWKIPPEFYENPKLVKPSTVLGEANVEKRRAYMEILGSSRYAELLDLEIKDQSIDRYGNLIELYRTRTVDELAREHLQFVKVTCPSTGRNYMLCVPPTIATAREAVAWTFGKHPDDYNPLLET